MREGSHKTFYNVGKIKMGNELKGLLDIMFLALPRGGQGLTSRIIVTFEPPHLCAVE